MGYSDPHPIRVGMGYCELFLIVDGQVGDLFAGRIH